MNANLEHPPGLAITLTLSEEQLGTLVRQVADRLAEGADQGFVDVDHAARFLGGCSRAAVYHLVERGRIRAHKLGGRLLFDPVELRADIERDG